MRNAVSLAVFLLFVLGGGLVIGYLTAPGEWYGSLKKPAYNPPACLFGPVWTVLYLMIAVAGWRLWRRRPNSPESILWWLQMALNFSWSPVFFSAHRIDIALAIILLLLAVILCVVALAWRRDRPAAILFIPYAAWVAFASLLNASLLVLNQDRLV